MRGSLSLGRDYAFDWSFFRKVREFVDGITFCDLDCRLDLFKEDHNPQLVCRLDMLNVSVFDLTIYNVHHIQESESERER